MSLDILLARSKLEQCHVV